jgi:hypothetical protein
MIKYYKEQKTGEEKVLRVDFSSLQKHPGGGDVQMYEVIFIKQASVTRKEGDSKMLVPIIAPGLIPEDAMKPDNKWGFSLNEISYEEFKLYVNKTYEQMGEIMASDELQFEAKLTAVVTEHTNGKSKEPQIDSKTK